ncbi:MAG: DUF362 domain-containing protein [Bacteroidetes bacterium]|nr:DUF362 domain-containing protein [Bacteroidota bacterium]
MIPTFISSPLGNLTDQIADSFAHLGLASDFNNAKSVFIKPNLTYPKYKEGVTTRKDFVEQLVAALRRINSFTKIYIGEGEGGYNSFSMTDAMRTMGYFELEEKYPNVKIVNISKVPSRTVELRAKGKPYPIDLPTLFDEIDFSITCPLPKVHCMTGITLSFKNQWGCLPDTMRLKNHYVFDEIIGQVCDKLKFKYAFLDGKYGLDDNGPMMGLPVEANWFAASNSLGAFDVIVSEMVGVNWKSIGHLRMAEKYGFIPSRDQIQVIGDPSALARKFKLNRTSWNYPALIAFRSKPLTHLFYFSKASKLLHDIMYIFREKPISD